jgi:hypothetical protein
VWLAMVTGTRRGELCALRWKHLDLSAGVLGVLCRGLPAKALIRGRDTVLGTQMARSPGRCPPGVQGKGPAVGRAPLEG